MDQKETEIEVRLGSVAMQQLKELSVKTGETLEALAARLLEQQTSNRWRFSRASVHALKREG